MGGLRMAALDVLTQGQLDVAHSASMCKLVVSPWDIAEGCALAIDGIRAPMGFYTLPKGGWIWHEAKRLPNGGFERSFYPQPRHRRDITVAVSDDITPNC